MSDTLDLALKLQEQINATNALYESAMRYKQLAEDRAETIKNQDRLLSATSQTISDYETSLDDAVQRLSGLTEGYGLLHAEMKRLAKQNQDLQEAGTQLVAEKRAAEARVRELEGASGPASITLNTYDGLRPVAVPHLGLTTICGIEVEGDDADDMVPEDASVAAFADRLAEYLVSDVAGMGGFDPDTLDITSEFIPEAGLIRYTIGY